MKRFIYMAILFAPAAWATYPGSPANPPPVPANLSSLVINNTVNASATTNGAGTSVSKAVTANEISATKAPDLTIQATTIGHSENVSTGGGTGTASTYSQIGGTATRDFGIGKGIVGVNVKEATLSNTNQSADASAAGRATINVQNVNGTLTEIKTAIGQVSGSGTGTIHSTGNAGAAFSNIAVPTLPNLGL